MLIIALTGGIGSGKSTVAEIFAQLGVPIVDTDVIARQLVEPGLPAYEEIVSQFGPSILTDDKQLDRARLREMIFNHAEQRRRLEQILHPRIRQEVQAQLAKLDSEYCIVVIPLLTEKGSYPFVDRILLVDSPAEQQIRRTMARDHQSREQVEQVLASQSDRQQRLVMANDVIDNSGDLASLEQQVRQLHNTYLKMSQTTGS
jgi:dephospho-CoA kinase